MSRGTGSLHRRIVNSSDLQSVVRTMKALAAANIAQYERSVLALQDYCRTVELGLGAALRGSGTMDPDVRPRRRNGALGAIVFGSDLGLVGPFNDVIADFAAASWGAQDREVVLWTVGERVHGRLTDTGWAPRPHLAVPGSVQVVASLVGEILVQTGSLYSEGGIEELHVYYNRPGVGVGYEPVHHRLLPLDARALAELTETPWPTRRATELLGTREVTLRYFTREYLFISMFRACVDSLASENASRLAAMQRADRNIEELLARLRESFHRQRQSGIDEELFDVVAGFEALRERSSNGARGSA